MRRSEPRADPGPAGTFIHAGPDRRSHAGAVTPALPRRLVERASSALVITAGFDPLRDEGEAYAAALHAAGTPMTSRRMPTMIHGFINMTDLSSSARAAFLDVAREARTMLGA
jgi:acetyl esterase